MLEKIKSLIAKVKERRAYDRCYGGMERLGIAAMGMCSGYFIKQYREETCNKCPYYRDVFEKMARIDGSALPMDNLKPCPFCGGEAVYMDKNTVPDRLQPTIECFDCGCVMSEINKQFLIESWNRRKG